ncbi:MAG: hypothetical protein AAB345_01850 [Patescibacteria group bacterium]
MGDQSSGDGRSIRVSSGAESVNYSGGPITVSGLRRKYREVMNITNDHALVFVNGRAVHDESDVVPPGPEVEFKKQAGAKG